MTRSATVFVCGRHCQFPALLKAKYGLEVRVKGLQVDHARRYLDAQQQLIAQSIRVVGVPKI